MNTYPRKTYDLWVFLFTETHPALMEAIDILGSWNGDTFSFNPKDPAFSEFYPTFTGVKPTLEQLRSFRELMPEYYAAPQYIPGASVSSEPVVPDSEEDKALRVARIRSTYKDTQLAVIDARASVCRSCAFSDGVAVVSVRCRQCGCGGVSLLNGQCRHPDGSKWAETTL